MPADVIGFPLRSVFFPRSHQTADEKNHQIPCPGTLRGRIRIGQKRLKGPGSGKHKKGEDPREGYLPFLHKKRLS